MLAMDEKNLLRAAYEQLEEMPYFPLTQSHVPAIKLAEKLNEWLGGDYVIFFSNSGSEANETAFKIARQYHQQKGNMDAINSFHAIALIMVIQWEPLQRQVKHNENINMNLWVKGFFM